MYGNDPEVITDRCVLPAVPGYCIQMVRTIIGSLAMVLLAAYICYFVHAVVVYSLTVSTLGGMSPVKFFKGNDAGDHGLHFPVHLLWNSAD